MKQHLREDLMESKAARPLGELIPAIAIKIRAHSVSPLDGTANIVPMPMVAAFVDGTASVDEVNMICAAVLIDNSVLAEIVAAVRSQLEQSSLPDLDHALTARLLAMQPFAISPTTATASIRPSLQAFQDAIQSVEIQKPAINHRETKPLGSSVPGRLPLALTMLAALAASILAIVWLSGLDSSRDTKTDSNTVTLGVNDSKPTQPEIQNQIDPPGAEPSSDTNMAGIQKDPNDFEPELVPDKNMTSTDTPASIAAAPDKNLDKDKTLIETLEPGESTQQPSRIAGIRWTKITGLLAHRIETPLQQATWGGIEIGSRDWDLADDLKSLELKTLPMSRAEASLASGGKIVLAADTGARWNRSTPKEPDRMELHYGQLAMIDLPKGTLLELQREGKMMGTLRWESKASVVLGVTASGLQAMIQGGEISINNDLRKNTTVVIERGKVTELKERSGRMPPWVAKATDSVVFPKGILAQIASSNNLGSTLSQLIESEQLDEPRSMLISAWRASLANESLMGQVNARRPVLRLAAMQRIVNTPEWDRRYIGIWTEVSTAVGDERKVQVLKSLAQLVRQKGKPSTTQVYAMISFLESPDLASRSLGDFLLRQFYSGGPVFDPSWTGEASARGVGLWRRFIAQN